MRLTEKTYINKNNKYIYKNIAFIHDYMLTKLGQLEDIEDNIPAFNGLQHLFAVIDLMENNEELHFTYKGKTFVIERNE